MNDLNERNTFALTTPLYYVNDIPHIGSAYTTIVADVMARWQRLQGNSVLLITGTDEHGQKIERTAAAKGLNPQEHCDRIATSFANLWAKLHIQYDRFSRTTAELLDNGCCPIHTNLAAEWRDEENYFFRLSKYQTQLEQLYQEQPDFIQPESRRNEVLNFVNQGLQDFSISRVNVAWGFPIPHDGKHTIYVWFDALLGYVTALLDPEDEPTLENALAKWWPIDLHLIGKDILRFHAIYWPAMLMSAGLPLPKRVFGHGFLTKDGRKMGKSLGNTLDPFDLVDRYGADAVRYYFVKEIELGQDGDFQETRFVNILNADLANDLGNLLNRTLGMVKKYCQNNPPQLTGVDIPNDNHLKNMGINLGGIVEQKYDALQFDQACEEILALIRASNKFIDESAPWSLFKQKQQAAVEQVLYAVLESVRLSAYLLSPIIPTLSSKIYQQLGFVIDFNTFRSEDGENFPDGVSFSQHCQWGLPTNPQLGTPEPIFSKLELPLNDS